MKKSTLFFFVFFISTILCWGQSSVWKISKDDKSLYLGGSIHILRAEDYPLPASFDYAFNNSDRLVFETDIEQIATTETTQMIMGQSLLPDGSTITDILNDSVYEQLNTMCTSFGMPLNQLAKLKPAIIVTILTMAKMQQLGFSSEGVDLYYFKQAKEAQKTIDFLESLEAQINLLTNMGIGYENEFVQYSLDDLNQVEQEIHMLVSEWKNGTSGEMEAMLVQMKESFPSVYKSMMADRNDDWIPKIEAFFKDDCTTFIIVGLAHMYGDDGLLQQLEGKGYHIEQM